MKIKIILFTAFFLIKATFCNGQENWDIGPEWAMNQVDDNYYLTGKNHSWANCN